MEPMIVTTTRAEYENDVAMLVKRYLAMPREAAKTAGVVYDDLHVVAEQPWAAIIETARNRGCDLIMMASHGRKGVSALILGSETAKVLTHTTIPTLVCR